MERGHSAGAAAAAAKLGTCLAEKTCLAELMLDTTHGRIDDGVQEEGATDMWPKVAARAGGGAQCCRPRRSVSFV